METSLYFTHILPNGLTTALLPCKSKIVYCGIAIRRGSRHDPNELSGLAHFVEHMLFKGTRKRKAWHILNRMEVVGGELNAYTTKEETVVYTVAPLKEIERSIELLSDLVQHSTFPTHEIEKERTVVADEINVYRDAPSEQIFEDFDALLFPSHKLGKSILGSVASLERIGREECLKYQEETLHADGLIFFCLGDVEPNRFKKLCQRHLGEIPRGESPRMLPPPKWELGGRELIFSKATHQTHTIIGGPAYSMIEEEKVTASLIMNYLAGPGMNSRLTLLLRERKGWVYNVEGMTTSLSDVGWWQIYFGSDPTYASKALKVVRKELYRLAKEGLSPSALRAWKKQIKGQLSISLENNENSFLNFGKQLLYFHDYKSPEHVFTLLDDISTEQILRVAQRMFDPQQIHTLIYNASLTYDNE